MSLADRVIFSAASAWNSVHADQWRILSGDSTGLYFIADAQSEQEIELNSDLGADAREKTVIYCFRPGPELQQGNLVSGKSQTWRVVRREDNPANARIKFELAKVADVDT